VKIGDRVTIAMGINDATGTVIDEVATGYGADPVWQIAFDSVGGVQRHENYTEDMLSVIADAPAWLR
jgi:hypothetical protein